ncbi:MAG TPA: hypothetical protein VGX00_06435 [Thermoplasmata archaeon]|nr:hypothetical protein [Thermoplasmata archaeon]
MIDHPAPHSAPLTGWEEPPERRMVSLGAPEDRGTISLPEGFRAACVWLSSPLGTPLTDVGEALRTRLSQGVDDSEFLHVDPTGSAAVGTADPTHHDNVTSLINAAAALVRRGVTTVVAYPLNDRDEIRMARARIPPLVRVTLGPVSPMGDPDQIPTTYRCIRDRRIVELAITPPTEANHDRADIVLNGTLGTADELSREIADVLYRAGWLSRVSGPRRDPIPGAAIRDLSPDPRAEAQRVTGVPSPQ